MKSISYRVVATITTASVVFLLTGRFVLAIQIGVIEVVSKILLYYLHERVWGAISWGKDNRLNDHKQSHVDS